MAGAFQLLSLKTYVSHLSCPCKTKSWALHSPLWGDMWYSYSISWLYWAFKFSLLNEWVLLLWHLPASHCLKVKFLALLLSLKIDQPFLYCRLPPSSFISFHPEANTAFCPQTYSKQTLCFQSPQLLLMIFPPSSNHGRRTLYLMKAHHEHSCCIITPSQV